MSLINYETSSLPYVKDKLIFFPPGPNAGLPGTPLSYVAVDDLGRFFRQQCLYETVYGVQLGATFIVFLMLVFLTRRSQRETWLFRFNALALLMNIARVISLLVPYFTALADPYAMASTDLSLVRPGTIAALVLEVWFNLFLVICCYSSLFLQAQSLTSTLWGRKRVVFICMNWSMAIIPPLARFIAAIPYSMDIVNRTRKLPAWVNTFVMGVFAFGTSYHALLFVGKLGYSMHTRKKLGLRQFGPIQVVFIMLCQTMFLPAFFMILEFGVPEGNLYNSISLTLLACFLPLSSFWAEVMSQMEQEELGLLTPKSKTPKRSRTRQSSNSCNTVWFDNPSIARDHMDFLDRDRSPEAPGTVGPSALGQETMGARLLAGSDTRDLEQGAPSPGSRRDNQTFLSSLAAVNRGATTLHYKTLSAAGTAWSDSSGLHPEYASMMRQSLESDGLSSHEATKGRSALNTPTSPYRVSEVYCDPSTPGSESSSDWDKQSFQPTKLYRISEVSNLRGQMAVMTQVTAQCPTLGLSGGTRDEFLGSLPGIRVERRIELHEEHLPAKSPSIKEEFETIET